MPFAKSERGSTCWEYKRQVWTRIVQLDLVPHRFRSCTPSPGSLAATCPTSVAAPGDGSDINVVKYPPSSSGPARYFRRRTRPRRRLGRCRQQRSGIPPPRNGRWRFFPGWRLGFALAHMLYATVTWLFISRGRSHSRSWTSCWFSMLRVKTIWL